MLNIMVREGLTEEGNMNRERKSKPYQGRKGSCSRQNKQPSEGRGDGGRDHKLRSHRLGSCEPRFLVLIYSRYKGKTFFLNSLRKKIQDEKERRARIFVFASPLSSTFLYTMEIT